MTVETYSAEETESLGERLGTRLQAGQVVTFSGPLGAGKTTLIRGLCRGLGVDPEQVSSPTFVIMQVYQGRHEVFHFDAYRLSGPDDLEGLGALDYLEHSPGVTLMEWPDRAAGLLPADRLEVDLELLDSEHRRVRLTATGPGSAACLELW